MADQGPSIADIQAARNHKIASESTANQEINRISEALQGAHQDALHLKEHIRESEGQGAVPHQQAFPHGSVLPSNTMDTQHKEHQGMGENIAEGVANADQSITTAARNAVHKVSETVTAAGTAAANAAGATVDKAKEAMQSNMTTRAANDGGRTATPYEGATFTSDDPDYKGQGGVTESRTPAHTLDELKGDSPNPTIATPKEEPAFKGLAGLMFGSWTGKSPLIATLKEPSSSAGATGVAVNDQVGGSNAMAAASTAHKSIKESVKAAFAGVTPAGAPAGPSDPDPRTANIPVGDFKALHQALGLDKDSSNSTSKATPATLQNLVDVNDVSRGTTDQDNAAALPSKQQMQEGWEGIKAEAQQGLEAASDRVQQGLDSASERLQEATGAGKGAEAGTGATGGGLLGSIAGIVSGIATKVNLANSSEELMAGGTVPDAAATPAAADGATTNPAPEAAAAANAAADAARKAGDTVSLGSAGSDATAAAKDAAAETAERVKQGAADLRDKASETASAAADSMSSAGQSVKEAVGDAAARAADAGNAAKESAANAAASARDSVAGAIGSAEGKASEAASQAQAASGGALSHLIQGAKEGFVGAYDAAASVLVGDDKPSHTTTTTTTTPTQDTSTSSHSPDTPAASGPPPGGLQSGAVGSGHAATGSTASEGGMGLGAVMKQGWEDLKHGGAKAPQAVSVGGETAAPWDVTSNIERSKHLHDPQEAKIYEAETYKVSPGAQSSPDPASSEAHKAGAVAGGGRPITGAVPHDKPETAHKVQAGQTTRFDGNKGMGTGFGTGSAAPWSGDKSVKEISVLFSDTHSSLDIGTLGPEEQQQLVEAATQAGLSAERLGSTSSSSGAVSSWVASMSAAWRHLGVASAKGPGEGQSTKEVKDNIKWESPTQDAVIDPVRGVTLKEGHSPGHKIQMRTGDQIPPDTDPSDPGFFSSKVDRLGKVVQDTLTTSSEEAAADPTNLKGKSSDNKPDGLAEWTKHEADVAGSKLAHAPEAAVSALGTAGQVISGVAGHVVDKAKELGHNLAQGDFMTPEERTAKSQAAVDRLQAKMDKMGPLATDHRAVQELQEERMAAIGDPAHKRDTLGEKIIGPMVGDASDPTHAKELAASYNEWKSEKEHGTKTSAAGSSSAASGSAGAAARGAAQEAADTARSAKDVVKMEGQAAGEGVQSAADKAGSAVGGAIESVKDTAKGLASEAADTAHAAGEVVSMEASAAADAVKDTADQATSRAKSAAHSAQDSTRQAADSAKSAADKAYSSAADTAARTRDSAKDTANRAGDSVSDAAARTRDAAKDAAHRAGDSVSDAAARTRDAAKDTANRAGDSVSDAAARTRDAAKDAAHRAGDSVSDAAARTRDAAKDTANRAGDRVNEAADATKDIASWAVDGVKDMAARAGETVQEGVDAVAEGTGYVAGAGAETMSEAQEAAARAGEKAGAAAGGVLSSVGEAAKGLLGALLGPFEREGAFDESTAALTGPPSNFDPVGAEQVSGAGMSNPQGPAATAAGISTPATAAQRAPASRSTAAAAAAPAGSDADELAARARESKEGVKQGLRDTQEGIRETVYETKEQIKARMQAGIDDTAKAASLAAGHLESTVESTVDAAKQQFAAVEQKIAAATEEIQVPPAEIPTNTEDLLRQRQAQLQQ